MIRVATMVEKPSVLIIGDSISMGYTPLVKELTAGRLDVERIKPNGGDSANVLAHLDEWIAGRPMAAIHFNCGLHDLKRDRKTGALQQPLEVYVRNLREIIRRLRENTAARLIWATITPVMDERHRKVKEFDRLESDVRAYNAAALEVVREAGLDVNDLHAAVEREGVEECICEDGVHMTPKGDLALARAVVICLLGVSPPANISR
ncbi:MAG: GDSL-type esterase/lipase family protein [Planctomycetota bacterium]|nr:GDSL-type esterase/lipase family protein [Planctomycetota bacterium]